MKILNLMLLSLTPILSLNINTKLYPSSNDIKDNDVVLFPKLTYFVDYCLKNNNFNIKAIVYDTPARLEFFKKKFIDNENVITDYVVNESNPMIYYKKFPNISLFKKNNYINIDKVYNINDSELIPEFLKSIEVKILDKLYSFLFYFKSSIENYFLKYLIGDIDYNLLFNKINQISSNEYLNKLFLNFINNEFKFYRELFIENVKSKQNKNKLNIDKRCKELNIKIEEFKLINKYFQKRLNKK